MFKSNDMLIPMTKYSVGAFFKVLIIPIVFSHGTGIKGVQWLFVDKQTIK